MKPRDSIVIAGVLVRQNAEGFYSLNDLHRASGGANKDRPSLWLENQRTQSLISAFESKAGFPALAVSRGGKNPGVYTHRRLATIYATWLNEDFYLQVAEAFDLLTDGLLLEAHKVSVRETVRHEYKAMNQVLLTARNKEGKDTAFFHYSNEADLVNRIVLGVTSAQFKTAHGLDEDASIRDVLTVKQLEAIYGLQRANTVYIDEKMDFQSRKERLINLFNVSYLSEMIAEDVEATKTAETLTLKVVA